MLTKKQQLQHNKKPRKKKCKECGNFFTPERDMQVVCGFECGINYAKRDEVKSKAINKIKKEFKDNCKSSLLKLAQKEVNKYIRLRDINKPCCTCGHKEGRQFHAGHYESVGGNYHQRFYTLNIHSQCSICNNYKSGNLTNYRSFMIDKYGIDKVEYIENDHSIKKYTVEYLQKLIKVFRKKIKLYETKFR